MIELSNEKLAKLNELVSMLATDERFKWYLAGLIDGYKIYGEKK